jgi:hypothetical protein
LVAGQNLILGWKRQESFLSRVLQAAGTRALAALVGLGWPISPIPLLMTHGIADLIPARFLPVPEEKA